MTILFAGSGCAALSLLMRMIRSGRFEKDRIVLVDKEEKNKNDRTWCYWEQLPGFFEPIVHRRWNYAWFHDDDFSLKMTLRPFQYKMIRGIDFYNYCMSEIRQHDYIEFIQGNVDQIDSLNGNVTVSGIVHAADLVFNSLMPQKTGEEEYDMLQHFKGRVIKTSRDVFIPAEATLMDFRIPQRAGTTFVYVMPFSTREALIEYTVFSKELLQQQEYDDGIDTYLNSVLQVGDYETTDTEFGVIPMTTRQFEKGSGKVVNIGTAGGQTKPSSGYTYNFIQKHSDFILNALINGTEPREYESSIRFSFYDHTLLNILYNEKLMGKKIFSDLFRKNDVTRVLKFLDNETTVAEELSIISTLPTGPFLKAGLQELFR